MDLKYDNKEHQKNFNQNNIQTIKVTKKYILKVRIRLFLKKIFKF